MDFIEEVRALAEEYEACGGCDGTGWETRRTLFNPPATMEEVRAFEQEMHLTLPENMVRYLTELGNGGIGPDYNIYSLKKMREKNPNAAAYAAREPMIGSDMPDEEWNAFIKAYEEADTLSCRSKDPEEAERADAQIEEMTARLLAGGIYISTPGCTMDTLLMCKGAAAGCVTTIDFEYLPYYRAVPHGTDFEGWMINGLHRKIEKRKNGVEIWLVTRYNENGLGMKGEALTDQIIALRLAQLREEGTKDVDGLEPAIRDFYRRNFENGSFRLYVGIKDKEVIGTAGLSFAEKPPYPACPSGKLGLLSSVYVKPEFRRRGIAKRLVGFVLRLAREKGCGAVHITASDAGVKLYSAMGFTHNKNFMQYTL